MKDRAYNRSLAKILKNNVKFSTKENNINPAKTFLILCEGSDESNRKIILEFANSLKKSGKTVKLLSYIDSKGELMDFGMAVYNNSSLNWYDFPKKHVFELLESQSFDILFNLNVKNRKHLHALACIANADFKLSLPAQYPHNFTMIIDTKEKQKIKGILDEITACLDKLTV